MNGIQTSAAGSGKLQIDMSADPDPALPAADAQLISAALIYLIGNSAKAKVLQTKLRGNRNLLPV
jgi:hypothetical protein